MKDLKGLKNKLTKWRKKNLNKYLAYITNRGQCAICGSTMRVGVFVFNFSWQTYCQNCYDTMEDCQKYNMSVKEYEKERQKAIDEVIELTQSDKTTEQCTDRDKKILELHEKGRKYSHIAEMFGISRERVRQIVHKERELSK